MKTKDIAAIINKAKHLSICERYSQQWIGDGEALYPVQGMPNLGDEEMLRFLDLEPEKISVEHITGTRIDFTPELLDSDDHLLDVRGPSFIDRGYLYRSYLTKVGAVIAQELYFKPIENDKDIDCEPLYYLRFSGKGDNLFSYIVAKKGLHILGYICPINYWRTGKTIKAYFTKFADQLKKGAATFGGREIEEE